MTPEGKVKEEVKNILNELGCFWFMPATGGYGKAGIPDFIICYRGLFIGVECKAGKEKLSSLQFLQGKEIIKAWGTFFVVNEKTIHLLKNWIQEAGTEESNIDLVSASIKNRPWSVEDEPTKSESN
jgi:hypothetical protein